MPIAYIGMGANLPSAAGPPEATLAAAVERLAAIGRIRCRSSLYSTAPVGYADQPWFLNAVVALETELSPASLLDALFAVERGFGRDRAAGIPNGPRTLDLDILLYGSFVLHEANLDIPHPRLAKRAFVLIPLQEMAPDLVIAPQQATVKQLLESLRKELPLETDAVVLFQSDVWRALPCGDNSAARPRPESGDPDR
ncbi:2-amino-4-hydroxy-6-hydroxymethyldihydropteridine diphosphokinase [Acidobacteria bacterium AB60]|nr:2-amino-4-hydroxy-6-hydroxymethyldihydropteridine diphosphokinase [Acidobacteria bacterium AB60]